MAFDGRGASNGTTPLTKHGGPRGFSALDVVVQGGFLALGSGPVEFGNWLLGPSLAIAGNLLATVNAQFTALLVPFTAGLDASKLIAVEAALVTFPSDFVNGGLFWTDAINGSPVSLYNHVWTTATFPVDPVFGPVLQTNQSISVSTAAVIKPIAGRRYRSIVTARVGTNSTGVNCAVSLNFGKLDPTYTFISGATEVFSVGAAPPSDANFTIADGTVSFMLDYAAPAAPPPFVRPFFGINGGGANAVVELLSFETVDVTELYGAQAAQAATTAIVATIPVKASAAEIRTATDDAKFPTSKSLSDSAAWQSFSGGEISGGTITPDMTKGYNRTVTIGANLTLAKPSAGLVDGQVYQFLIIEDATGGRTITLNAFYVPGSIAFSFTTAANTYNVLSGTYNLALDKLIGCSVWKSA